MVWQLAAATMLLAPAAAHLQPVWVASMALVETAIVPGRRVLAATVAAAATTAATVAAAATAAAAVATTGSVGRNGVTRRRWTAAEDEAIREQLPRGVRLAALDIPDRSKASIAARASKLRGEDKTAVARRGYGGGGGS